MSTRFITIVQEGGLAERMCQRTSGDDFALICSIDLHPTKQLQVSIVRTPLFADNSCSQVARFAKSPPVFYSASAPITASPTQRRRALLLSSSCEIQTRPETLLTCMCPPTRLQLKTTPSAVIAPSGIQSDFRLIQHVSAIHSIVDNQSESPGLCAPGVYFRVLDNGHPQYATCSPSSSSR